MNKIKLFIKPHLIGLVLMLSGWYISILNVGLDKFSPNALISKWTLTGLAMILLGAYIPEIFRMFEKKS